MRAPAAPLPRGAGEGGKRRRGGSSALARGCPGVGATGRGHIISGERRRGELCRQGRVARRGFKPGRDGTGRAAASGQPGRGCVTRGRQAGRIPPPPRRRLLRRSRPPRPAPARPVAAGRPPALPQPRRWHLRAAPKPAEARRGLQSLPAGTGKATGSPGGGKKGERSRLERGSEVRVVPSKGERRVQPQKGGEGQRFCGESGLESRLRAVQRGQAGSLHSPCASLLLEVRGFFFCFVFF